MEHRFGDAAEGAGYIPVSSSGGYLHPSANAGSGGVPVGAPVLDQTFLVNSYPEPTARFVDAGPLHPSAKRKISRLDDKYVEEPPSHRTASASGRAHLHPRNREGEVRPGEAARSSRHSTRHPPPASSPKRVDFSERLRLREVKWDGTYRDSVAHNDNSTLGLSAAPSTIYPASSAAAPPSSSDSQSTLTDPRAIRETEIRFLNEHITESLQRHDRAEAAQRRGRSPRLTHVDVQLPRTSTTSGRGGSAPSSSAQGRAGEFFSSRGVPASDGVCGGSSASGGGSVSRALLSHGVPVPAPRSRTPTPPSMSSERGGDSGEEERGAVGGAESREERTRKQKIKKSLKELPQDDDILAKLREKIRQQRLSASSTDTSQNDSLSASVLLSDYSRDSTPQHMLHDEQEPIKLGAGDGGSDASAVPEKMPRSRKVAAGPPTPTYKGFSEVHLDPHLQATVNKVNRLHAPQRKSGSQKSHNPVQAHMQGRNSPDTVAAPAPSSLAPEKPKKAARLVAHGKKPSKPGAKNLITTSSWRAGQELILRELGPAPKSKVKGQSSGPSADDVRQGREEQRRPDGAEGNMTNSTRIPATGADNSSRPASSGGDHAAQLAQSRALSEDAKRMLSDLQLENEDREKHSSPARRPGVKRKAPRAEKESEKQQPLEKQRHYDTESVRQFMARQKAERQRKRDEARKAEQLEMQKRQQLMQELISKQRSAASTAKPSKKVKRVERGKQRVLFPASSSSEQVHAFDQRIRALLGTDSDKENADQQMDIRDDDDSDADTLTGDSEEGSTPRATPVNVREDAGRLAVPSTTSATESDLNERLLPSSAFRHPSSSQPASLPTSLAHSVGGGGSIEFQGKKLNLDIDSVLNKFSQVVNQRRSQGGGAEGEFRSLPARLEGHAARSREERLQALKTSSKTLQSKLASAEISLKPEVQARLSASGGSNPDTEFVPRYERIAGSQDGYSVFTSNLPGAQNFGSRVTDTDSASDGPPPRLASTGVRTQLKENTVPSRPTPASPLADIGDDDSTLTETEETSTFSTITAEDELDGETPRHRKTEAVKSSGARQADGAAGSNAKYTTPNSFKWENPCSDPYSVLNVFSRQLRSGNAVAMNSRDGSSSAHPNSAPHQDNSTRLKDPVLMSTHQVLYGQTRDGHPIVAKTSYTRFEATIPDRSQGDTVSQASQPSGSVRNRTSRSEERSVQRSLNAFAPARARSASEDSKSLDSDEDAATPKAASSHQTSKKSVASYRRQVSDTGQETDVSQLSEDEPRVSARYDGPTNVQNEVEEEAKWSPAALERQMAAELARLESLEDSLRQLSSADRTRAVALAQQETVSVAQVLKARQQAHTAELRSLQLQVQEERLASAQLLQQQMYNTTGVQTRGTETQSLTSRDANRAVSSKQLLEQAENRRPESRSTSLSRSKNHDDSEYSESIGASRGKSVSIKTVSRYDQSGKTSSTTRSRTGTTEFVKTAEDSQADSDSSIKTASDLDLRPADDSIAQEVRDEDYSMSFEDSMTEEESFKQVLPSESHRKDAKRRKSSEHKPQPSEEGSSLALGDLTSLFIDEDSFSRFTADMVRQIMREEELRAQHQAALLRLREKALKEKTKAELAWLQQQRQQVRDKGADDVHPQLQRKEQKLLKQLQEQQAEIRHLQEANRLASKERQSLLKQHEQIARMQQETRDKMKNLQGRLGHPEEGHTEDELSMVDGNMSDVGEDTSLAKEVKSDWEVSSPQRKQRGEKQNMAKQQKLRLDQKYLTAREQRLLERKKHASDLLKWKQDLDAEEEKVLQMERHALQAWEGRVPPGATRVAATDKKEVSKEETEKKVKAPGNLRPDASARSETVTTARDDSYSRTRTVLSQASEAVSTHISASEATTDRKKSQTERTESSVSRSRTPRTRSPPPSSSDGSIPEDINGTVRDRTPSQDRRLDSSDDTIVNSSVDEEMETPARKGKKSPVETQSDVSDYEVRIRQLGDMLRRRRKEADMLKKERSRRQKDKLKAQEETLKKQLEAYENYIAQVKAEQADLEHEAGRPGVRPQIKQPRVVSPNKSLASPSTSPGPPSQRSRDEGSNSDGTDSNQTSPALSEGQDAKVSPLADKDKSKKKPSSLMDRISEGSESASSKQGRNAAAATSSSGSEPSVSEAIEEAVDEISTSSRSKSAMLNIKTSLPSPADVENHSLADENQSYSFDFTDNVSRSLGQSHSKIPMSLHEGSRAKDASVASTRAGKSEAEVSEYIESAVSTAKSDSASAPKFDLKAAPESMKDASASISTRPTTGIQESDSENESRINSHRSLSRPSSERSTGSTTYSDLHDFDEVEEDMSSESDRTPVKGSVSQKEPSHSKKELSLSQKEVSLSQKERSVIASVRTDDDISEHISASLPSISEKRSVSGAQVFGHQDSIDAALGDLLGPPDEEEATPTVTPRPESPFLGQDEISGLLMTDPLADFHEGDFVLVWGHLKGVLLFKGTVAFAPGFWAGVELDEAEGDTDGERDGKRYFTCHRDHGVLVPGSEISPMEENGMVEEAVKNVVAEAIKSPDESLTDQDEISSATEKSEPSRSRSEKEGVRTPVKEKSPQRQKRNLDLLADDITADLAQSLVAESVEKMNAIVTRNSPPRSPAKVPPPTLPKPKITPQEQQQVLEKPPHEKLSPEKPNKEKRVDNTTSAVVTNLLDDAISEMIKIRRGRLDGSKEVLHNGYSDDSGVDRSHDSSLDPALGVSPEPELGSSMEVKEMAELRRPMSPEPFQRPRSPVPGSTALSAEERQELDEDLSGLLGDDQEFEDDDYGLSKPPPPYPGSGDQASGAERPAATQKLTDDIVLYVIPRQRAEVEGIVADAVSIYWNLRRCGEAWESATPPSTFLQESSTTQGGAGDDTESGDLVTGSRRIYKQLLFDLTGEIVREIYQYENDEEPAPWQKPAQKRQRYFKGVAPPTTMDILLPLVQTTVVDILGLNGSTGKFRGRTANKWNVRKKKDHVDAVLVEELREEEADWINYDHDELAVKMQLTDNLFDSLLSDTVDALNRVYLRRQLRPQP